MELNLKNSFSSKANTRVNLLSPLRGLCEFGDLKPLAHANGYTLPRLRRFRDT